MCVIFVSQVLLQPHPCNAASVSPFQVRALVEMSRLQMCHYRRNSNNGCLIGVYDGESTGQTAFTLETLVNVLDLLSDPSASQFKWAIEWSFDRTPIIAGESFEDAMQWGLMWMRAFRATNVMRYLQRAADIFDYMKTNAWDNTDCNGGVLKYSKTASDAGLGQTGGIVVQKSALATELFILLAIELQDFYPTLGKSRDYYKSWAETGWAWMNSSPLLTKAGDGSLLVGEGLSSTCEMMPGTSAAVQGVALSVLRKLAFLTSNRTYTSMAVNIFTSVQRYLSVASNTVPPIAGAVLQEASSMTSDGLDSNKGIFMRHVTYWYRNVTGVDLATAALLKAYMLSNAAAAQASACETGGYAYSWNLTCASVTNNNGNVKSVASSSSALDALIAGAVAAASSVPATSALLGPGACVDGFGYQMTSCSRDGLSESQCAAAALEDPLGVAYDFQVGCDGLQTCRVRRSTVTNAKCAAGWMMTAGTGGKSVTKGNGDPLTLCVAVVRAPSPKNFFSFLHDIKSPSTLSGALNASSTPEGVFCGGDGGNACLYSHVTI